MLVTFSVLKLLRSRDVKDEQSPNMPVMTVRLSVLRPFKFREANDVQP